ncbi:MAG: hypothetical protein SFU86_18265 [Pirellulaceae bacterium]|nr:hypothetical protein [Pirellulaceae bacterium]
MKAALNWLGMLLVALCIGTTISLAVIAGMLWWKGAFTDDRVLGMLAVLQGIELASPAAPTAPNPQDDEQPSLRQQRQERLAASLDLDLRESAIDKSLGDLRTLESQIRTERERLDLWKQSFDQRLANLETQATDQALLAVQQTLEAMSPRQAKEQILKMLEERAPNAVDDPVRDVVTIMKTMPLDKRRKIIAEFKSPDESEKLAEILHDIRVGLPDADVIRDTRNQLQQQLKPQR